jgi:transposase
VLNLPYPHRVFAATAPADMRKSFTGLVGLVEKELGRQVEAGGLFLFFSRRRNAVKVLFFTGDGLAIFYRRLEQGTFELPSAVQGCGNAKGIELKLSELNLILDGIQLASVKHRRRWSRPPQLA